VKNRTFKLSPVAKGIALAVGATTLTPAAAQEIPQAIEEITVTGIRGSLQSAMNMKRDGQGVVDGLVAGVRRGLVGSRNGFGGLFPVLCNLGLGLVFRPIRLGDRRRGLGLGTLLLRRFFFLRGR